MKHFLLLLFVTSFSAFGVVGWKGNAIEADAVGRVVKDEEVTADDQLVGVRKQSLVKLTSDSATATDRTVRLTVGEIRGQSLQLFFTGGNAIEILDDQAIPTAGNIKLSANWTPDAFDTLNLFWTGNHWLEVSRSTN